MNTHTLNAEEKSQRNVWIAAGVRTPFSRVDGPLLQRDSLTLSVPVAAALVFLLLLYLYESFRVAGAMLFVALLAVAGVYFGLWVTGTEFNITSRMGMTMIIGIVTEVSTYYLSEFRTLPPAPGRFIQAGLNRMRPIAMTTVAAIFALAPLAFGIGEGSAMLQPLTIAIIAGLIFQLGIGGAARAVVFAGRACGAEYDSLAVV